MTSNSGMHLGAARPVAPAIMRIGAARLTAGLDRYPRLDLEAHRDLFGRLPRLSDADILAMGHQVDLRGHGGAAFPFARKLKAVIDAAHRKDQPTVVVVNATEGEPGSFKDKMLLMRSPYLILSGAALAAEAIGAEEIVIGVASNELANRSLEAAVAAEPGLRDLVRIVEVPERFISGESGALIRAINGKTPIPPGHKVLAAESGVGGLPTLLSNAETYAQLAVLALLGPERYASVGMPEEPGTVLLSVSGSAARPAVVEVPTGVPLGSVLDICQAPAGDGVLVGGYHGMWLTADHAYVVPVSRAGLEAVGGTLGAGIVLPLGDGTCPLGEVSRIASYLAGESAGQCGPCKLGLPGSRGRWPRSWTARAASRPWTWPGVRPPPWPGVARARTRTAPPGSCCPRWTCSPRTWPRTCSTPRAAARSGACCRYPPDRRCWPSSGWSWTGPGAKATACAPTWSRRSCTWTATGSRSCSTSRCRTGWPRMPSRRWTCARRWRCDWPACRPR